MDAQRRLGSLSVLWTGVRVFRDLAPHSISLQRSSIALGLCAAANLSPPLNSNRRNRRLSALAGANF